MVAFKVSSEMYTKAIQHFSSASYEGLSAFILATYCCENVVTNWHHDEQDMECGIHISPKQKLNVFLWITAFKVL